MKSSKPASLEPFPLGISLTGRTSRYLKLFLVKDGSSPDI